MRAITGLLVALMVVLAGCNAIDPSSGVGGSSENGTTTGPAANGTATSTASNSGSGSASTGSSSGSGSSGSAAAGRPADPSNDRLGWENGIWYNETLNANDSDGLNANERGAIVNRTMARIEVVRQLEYTKPVPVDVIARTDYRNQSRSSNAVPSFRRFDNAKFEAMFLVGEGRNSLAVQEANRGSSVLGYYSPRNDSIVVVSNTAQPTLNASTLAHELVHALQDQQFDLSAQETPTRDQYNARNGLVEGEANFVQRRYEERFTDPWENPRANATSSSGGNRGLHYGIIFLNFFPYSDGPGLIESVYENRGWEGVNAMYENVPASAEQVIYPPKYREDAPTNVTIRDSSSGEWRRVRPESPRAAQERPDYAVLGQSALSSMFAYPALDCGPLSNQCYNRSSVVPLQQVFNYENSQRINSSDPYNYDLRYTDGWDGDRMYVYRNDANETGYVWKITWDSPGDAREFAAGYRMVLEHWGGSQVSASKSTYTWRVAEDSPFADAFRVQVEGNTVTITNAPTVEDLDAINGA